MTEQGALREETGIDIRAVDVSALDFNDYNPNEMEAEFFENLVNVVREEGMNQPVLVREDQESPGRFIVVDGEHRVRAAQVVGLQKIAVVVVDKDDVGAKVRTLSMNAIRGQNVPIKLARVIVGLQQTYSDDEIAAMTGIRQDEQEAVLRLLEVPDLDLDDVAADFSVGADETSRPIPVNLMLMPDEHGAYTDAMVKAMRLGGPDIVPLVGNEADAYTRAMSESMGLTGVKLRNIALAAICETFAELPDDLKMLVAARIRDRVLSKGSAVQEDDQATQADAALADAPSLTS